MIDVTRLGGFAMVVNIDQILTIEQTPDTVIALVNGDRFVVRESPEELVRRIVAFKRRAAADGAQSAA